ncbi:Stk1 family PASTA domain-containing Ser/Thr kinase [Cytobacillus oceanisediminis]|uniref:Serine/threonine-protein kinase PrkC n=1 Tax=Niallia alba TaxID=2729105 RepID=A0A7Y0K7Q6_9BACI|nr:MULTISPECIES: Stk1 family PASTA domain-containing Ser/Thr kinase [Bacillaceae]MBZ9532764.1 Stk1 family PASTA domain-containing Ser/Thr kinase [Cytobacillus oceanisediminis]NMO77290.1 Stk1 family PASTA domain-containing Ser/Thr kinase [Niallia alba]
MMIGKRISGRYKVLDMVGGGGMANVYLAHDMILDRDVAVKMLRLDYVNDEEFIKRFHREAQSATSLAHPNIVNIYDVGEEGDIYYIVMEYVEGDTLKQYIHKHSPLSVETVIAIMQQITSAIAHAHQNNIIHRDIKPHNILIDKDGNVKVTDFGIAMALSATSITQTNSVLGSVHYLSPEQARGGMANKKSDIYSLGIVMFELLTGRLPFSGESAVSIALKHLQSETPSVRRWNEVIPQSVENIVLKATAKDPFYRYNSMEEMSEDLRTALDEERMDESKFSIPVDDEATKAIPVITNDGLYKNFDETIVHKNEKEVPAKQQVNEKPKKPEKKEKKKKEKKKGKKIAAIIISTFLALILIMGLVIFVLPDLLAPDDIVVPDVTGLEVDAAKTALEDKGFVVSDTITLNSDEVEKGHVIKTSPSAGSARREGTEIVIYESLGKETVVLSDYVGRKYDDVVKLLESEGFDFKDIDPIEVFDDSEPGTILEQNFDPNEEVVPSETSLEFTISKGVELISIKDLSDYTKKEVNDYVDAVGLTVKFTEEYSDSVEKGLVISQSPEARTNLKKGTEISVVLSKGKKEVQPKEVMKEISIPYEPTEMTPDGKPVEQTVRIYIGDFNNSMTEPAETFTITENTKKTIYLQIPEGQKGYYRVQIDSVVILDEEVPYPN